MLNNNRGHVMIFALIILLLIIVFVEKAVTQTIYAKQISELQLNKKKAYYFAEAGIEHINWKMITNNTVSTGQIESDTYVINIEEVTEKIEVVDIDGTEEVDTYKITKIEIRATGVFKNSQQSIRADKEFHYKNNNFNKKIIKERNRVN